MKLIGRLENVLKNNNWELEKTEGLESIIHVYSKEQLRKTGLSNIVNKQQRKGT